MARISNASERYQRINYLFNLRKGNQAIVTTEELLGHLGISLRQLRTDIKKMKEMGAPLEYVARERGWRYNRPFDFSESIPLSGEDIMQLRLAVATLSQVNQLPGFENLTEIFGKIHQSVRRWVRQEATAKALYFDPIPSYEGSIHLPFFLQAIETTRQVVFNYQPFLASEPRKCVFDPYFLRQHHQRWYVGGFSHDPEELFIRTYPLERITGLPELSGHFFNKPQDFHPPDYWKHLVGINRPAHGKVESVVLEFSYLHGQYFLSTPFFAPFEVLENTRERLVVKMQLMPDIELIRRVAAYGKEVKVLAPASLSERLKKFFKEALNKYE
ncbi:MAG: WYL domain-containing transcriptional regulator [Lewinellaceae bacterium]|nr:WYL domain-containing transcriptional regulator [Lewinellaceae bacterium]